MRLAPSVLAPLLLAVAVPARAADAPLPLEPSGLAALAFAPDATRAVSIGTDRRAHLWDLAAGRLVRELAGKGKKAVAAAFAPDGKRLALLVGEPAALLLADGATGAVSKTVSLEKAASALAFSPDGKGLALTLPGGAVSVVDPETGVRRKLLGDEDAYAPEGPVAIAWGPGGAWVATTEGASIVVRDTESGAELARAEYEGGLELHGLAVLSPSRIAAGAREGIFVLDLAHATAEPELFLLPEARVGALAPGGKTLAAATPEGVFLLDAATGRIGRKLPSAHGAGVQLAYSPDGKRLFAGCADGSLVRCDPAADGAAPEPPDAFEVVSLDLAGRCLEAALPRLSAAIDRAGEPTPALVELGLVGNGSARHADSSALRQELAKRLRGCARIRRLRPQDRWELERDGKKPRWLLEGTLSSQLERDASGDRECVWFSVHLLDRERHTVEAALVSSVSRDAHGVYAPGTPDGDRVESDLSRVGGLGPRDMRAAVAKLVAKLEALPLPDDVAPPGGRAVVDVGPIENGTDRHFNTDDLDRLLIEALSRSKTLVAAEPPQGLRDVPRGDRRPPNRLAINGRLTNERSGDANLARTTWRIELELVDHAKGQSLAKVQSENVVETKP